MGGGALAQAQSTTARVRLPGLIATALTLGALALPAPASAQSVATSPRPGATGPAPVPFGLGERWEFQVKLGVMSAGSGYMAVEGSDTVRGRPTYRLAMGLEGGLLFAKV